MRARSPMKSKSATSTTRSSRSRTLLSQKSPCTNWRGRASMKSRSPAPTSPASSSAMLARRSSPGVGCQLRIRAVPRAVAGWACAGPTWLAKRGVRPSAETATARRSEWMRPSSGRPRSRRSQESIFASCSTNRSTSRSRPATLAQARPSRVGTTWPRGTPSLPTVCSRPYIPTPPCLVMYRRHRYALGRRSRSVCATRA
jgi:hypothetical protein